MADPTTHPDFDLDTALSADLDGELDGYASELGLDVTDVRAALAAPAATARRVELAAVRTSLRAEGTAVPPLDDVTRRRLLTGAGVDTGSGRSAARRDHGPLLRAGVAAAVTLLVLGGVYAIVRDSGDSGGSAAKSGTSGDRRTAAVTGELGDVGTIDPAQVAGFLQGRAAAAPSGSTTTAPSAPTADQSARSGGSASFAEAGPATVAACADRYASEGSVRFRGSGTFQGRPAVLLGIDTSRRTIVFVVAADDCTRVLYSASR